MLKLSLLPEELGICRLEPSAGVPDWAAARPFSSVTRTSEELSVVCAADVIPPGVACERGWRALKVHGPLAFTAIGILSSLAEPLARAGIGIFVISTYDTDYLLVKDHVLGEAVAALRAAGHEISSPAFEGKSL